MTWIKLHFRFSGKKQSEKGVCPLLQQEYQIRHLSRISNCLLRMES